MNPAENLLLAQISEGNELAFKQLFECYKSRLFGYVLKVTKSREIAEEIVMDVFLKLWEGKALVNEIENFPSFIFLIARNKAIDFLRKASKDRVLQELIWDEIQLQATISSDELIRVSDLKRELNTAVNKLSAQRQVVYRLSREEYMSHDQIAKHLQLSKSTVKNHMIDALRIIRLHLSTRMGLIISLVVLAKKYF